MEGTLETERACWSSERESLQSNIKELAHQVKRVEGRMEGRKE